jgi:hypothetical protein
LCALLKMLEVRASDIRNALDPNSAHATDFRTLIARAKQSCGGKGAKEPPAGFEEPLTLKQAKALEDAMDALEKLMNTLSVTRTHKASSEPFQNRNSG